MRDGLGFSAEERQHLLGRRIADRSQRSEPHPLQGHAAAERRVASFVDDAKPTAAELAEDLEAPDLLTRFEPRSADRCLRVGELRDLEEHGPKGVGGAWLAVRTLLRRRRSPGVTGLVHSPN